MVDYVVIPGVGNSKIFNEAAAMRSLSVSSPDRLEPDAEVALVRAYRELPDGVGYAILPPDVSEEFLNADLQGTSKLFAEALDGADLKKAGHVSMEIREIIADILNRGQFSKDLHPLLKLLISGAEYYQRGAELPLDMFVLDDRNRNVSGQLGLIGLAGRARYVLHGGYFWLPRGNWRVVLIVDVDHDAVPQAFRLEWGGLNEYVSSEFIFNIAGRYEVMADFDFLLASPAEVRLVLSSSSLGGTIRIQSVYLTLQAVDGFQ